MMNTDPFLDAACQAIQQGEQKAAAEILIPYLDQHPKHAAAWFLLSGVTDTPQAAARCLRNVIAIEPQHTNALKMLESLAQQTGLDPLQVMQITADSAAYGRTCPFCSSTFSMAEAIVVCPQCTTAHHHDCWSENGYCCATILCQGYSLNEIAQDSLPIQPSSQMIHSDRDKPIVIKKEDISDTEALSRKDKEQKFQRQLLLAALLAEEGQVSAHLTDALPSVEEIIDQIQRDRGQSTGLPPISHDTNKPSPVSSEADKIQSSPFAIEASGIVTGVIPLVPQPVAGENGEIPAICAHCGQRNINTHAQFCSHCGTEQNQP